MSKRFLVFLFFVGNFSGTAFAQEVASNEGTYTPIQIFFKQDSPITGADKTHFERNIVDSFCQKNKFTEMREMTYEQSTIVSYDDLKFELRAKQNQPDAYFEVRQKFKAYLNGEEVEEVTIMSSRWLKNLVLEPRYISSSKGTCTWSSL